MSDLYIAGTRPEFLKMLPVLLNAQTSSDVLMSGQHSARMAPTRLLSGATSGAVTHRLHHLPRADASDQSSGRDDPDVLASVIQDEVLQLRPDRIIVQGDTRTAYAGGLAAQRAGVPLVHIEAGLRTRDLQDPYPEERFRVCLSNMADFHFAPTELAAENLVAEGIDPDRIEVTGNTAVDLVEDWRHNQSILGRDPVRDDGLVLVTLHRNEAHGDARRECLTRIRRLSQRFQDLTFLIVSHPNPRVKADLRASLDDAGTDRGAILIEEAMTHERFLELLARSRCIISDSGGIQEEAPSLGKRVFIARNVTERPEGLGDRRHVLVGRAGDELGRIEEALTSFSPFEGANPFGDGRAGPRIADLLQKRRKIER